MSYDFFRVWEHLRSVLYSWRHNSRRGLMNQHTRRSCIRLEVLEDRFVPAVEPLIGTNVETIADWSAAWTFTDAFKSSRPWISHAYNTSTGQSTWEGGGVVHVDSKGWPTQLNQWKNTQNQMIRQELGTLIFRDIGTNYPAGTYRAEWKGTGEVYWGFAARLIEQGKMSDGTNYALLNITPDAAGIYVKIATMDTTDPIREMHLWMPEYNGQKFAGQVWQPGASFSPFHPQFLQRLAPFNTIRFMDWEEINGSDMVSWSDRRPYDYATQQSGDFRNGVAPEYMVALCNQLDANAWVNMPHMADDIYVRNLATLMRDTLEPGRKVYVEWSNETWNGGYGFEGYSWVTQELNKPENAYLLGNRWALIARETKRDFDIWSDVFANQQDRLVRVVAGQQANSWIAEQILSHMGGHFDAVSCSAYIHLDDKVRSTFSSSTTADQVIDALIAAVPTAVSWLQDHRQLTTDYSKLLGRPLSFVAYEGGPHLDGQGGRYQSAFFAAGTNPRMYEVYARLLEGCQSAGLNEFLQYSLTGGLYETPFGSFGALQHMEQPLSTAPKYQALLDATTGALYKPRFSIEAVNAAASETGPTAATYRIRRAGSPSGSVVLSLTVSGTASAADYTGVTTSLTFAVGETEKVIRLMPVDDALIEGNEQVNIALATGSGYSIDASHASINLIIQDNDVQTVNGLQGQYFDIANLAMPTLVRNDQYINFNWGTGSPHALLQPDRFSVRWTGWIQPIETGSYVFRTYSDEGVRLTVNRTTLINNWVSHTATYNTSATINLTAGQMVPIQLDYYEATGSATIVLQWKRPKTTTYSEIPVQCLAPENNVALLGKGMQGAYYDISKQTTANRTQIDAGINFRWNGSPPVTGFTSGPFVVRWMGWITSIEAGTYQFATTSDDGIRMWLNGALSINNPTNRTTTTTTSSSITLAAGQRIQVQLEYYGYYNKSLIRLDWRRSGATTFVPIPLGQLTPP